MTEYRAAPIAAGVWLPRVVTEYYWTHLPREFYPMTSYGDPTADANPLVDPAVRVRIKLRPDRWRPTSPQGLASHAVAGNLAWWWRESTGGILELFGSQDGTTTLGPWQATESIPELSTLTDLEWTRRNSDGTLIYSYSRDNAASWKQIGDPIDTPDGPLHLTSADIRVGMAAPISGTDSYKGLLRKFSLQVDGGTVDATLDLQNEWANRNGPWSDSKSNRWFKNGDPADWRTDRSGMDGGVHDMDLHRLMGWSIDPGRTDGTGSAPTLGVATCVGIMVPRKRTISKICTRFDAGATGTVKDGELAIYDQFLNRIATTGLGISLTTGDKEFSLTGSVDLEPGNYVGVMNFTASGGTPLAPKVACLAPGRAAVNSGGTTSLGFPFFTADTGLAPGVLPAKLSRAAVASNHIGYYMGVR